MFRGLVVNEWLKLIHKRRFVLTTAIFLAFSLYSIGNAYYWNYVKHPPKAPAVIEQELRSAITNTNKKLATVKPGSEEWLSNTEYLTDQKLNLEEQGAIKNGQWQVVAKKRIAVLEKRISEKEAAEKEVGWEYEELAKNKYYLAHNITPEWMYPGKVGGVEGVYSVFGSGALLLALMIVLMVADIVSGEMSDGTVKLLLTRPPGRWKILTAKYVTAVTSTIALVMVGALITLALNGLVFGIHDYNQPEAVGKKYIAKAVQNELGITEIRPFADGSGVKAIPRWQFGLAILGLLLIPLITVATLTFAASVIFNTPLVGMGLMTAALMGGVIFEARMGSSTLLLANFVTYLRLYAYLVTGSPVEGDPISPVNLAGAIAILVAYCLVSLAAAYAVFKRRDILV
ncbi:MAG: ABC transporter permease subunit [Clostridia bacterium]|nr:ABC transporter permease subunit [Clostridia bacterium]